MRLATDADIPRIEEICNDPLIRVWTACDGAPPCSGAQYVNAPSFSVIGDEGVFLAKHLDGQRFAIHTNLLPHCRGAAALMACEEALQIAFLQTGALELVTMTPANMPHAALMARRNGFRHLFDRKNVWPVQGQQFDMSFYTMSIDDWIMAGHCKAAGEAFHARLHDELNVPSHPDDPIHNAYVGAAVEMVRNGQVEKAIAVYNKFARFALYQPVQVVSHDPLRIDIRQCVLRIEGDSFHMEASHA